ncbi:MAG: hypothetical protein P5683_17830 [Limnospira sp. PMC 1279.21]|uniref:hypothetical protein n=1 Tax=Limnospira sp. PMC 1279.21 TaxID=2981062 RepID=UPI0028E167D2|nr:hypothetical protein [Limnospira sp. PMC 1279.21]MDT9225494.1 hypothetical protein [Limnospira sp. PMC 1279.21]
MRSSQGMSAGELLKQANQLKRSGKFEEAIALYNKGIENRFNTVYNTMKKMYNFLVNLV